MSKKNEGPAIIVKGLRLRAHQVTRRAYRHCKLTIDRPSTDPSLSPRSEIFKHSQGGVLVGRKKDPSTTLITLLRAFLISRRPLVLVARCFLSSKISAIFALLPFLLPFDFRSDSTVFVQPVE